MIPKRRATTARVASGFVRTGFDEEDEEVEARVEGRGGLRRKMATLSANLELLGRLERTARRYRREVERSGERRDCRISSRKGKSRSDQHDGRSSRI